MRTINTGDLCHCCGQPVRLTDPEALRMLAMMADLLGLPETGRDGPGLSNGDVSDSDTSPGTSKRNAGPLGMEG